MEARLVDTTPTARNDALARCLIAIELSKATSQYRLAGGDWQSLLKLIERIRRQVSRELGRPVEMISCYEAGYDGFWLHRLLEAHGVRNHVLDPASLLVNRRARRAKTDRIDVERMLRALGRYLRGEPDACSVVRVPSVEQEDARRLHRERHRLIRARLKAEIIRELQRLELVLKMIAQIEAERDAIVKEAAPQHLNAGKIKALVNLKSIGPEFATTLVGEVFYRSFDNRRQVGGYIGVAPSPYSSGSMDRDQGISKAGNPKARSTAIELAWMWLRYQPDSTLSIWFRQRVGDRKGRVRRIAIVALARKLLVALWRYLDTGLVPAGAVFKTR